jgi:hypothetical protein
MLFAQTNGFGDSIPKSQRRKVTWKTERPFSRLKCITKLGWWSSLQRPSSTTSRKSVDIIIWLCPNFWSCQSPWATEVAAGMSSFGWLFQTKATVRYSHCQIVIKGTWSQRQLYLYRSLLVVIAKSNNVMHDQRSSKDERVTALLPVALATRREGYHTSFDPLSTARSVISIRCFLFVWYWWPISRVQNPLKVGKSREPLPSLEILTRTTNWTIFSHTDTRHLLESSSMSVAFLQHTEFL